MPNSICVTCGTQFAHAAAPPAVCPICADERQYVGSGGQQWTTLADLQSAYANRFQTYEPGLIGVGTEPRFAIGQRALLVQTPHGNLLWDCVSLIDQVTIDELRALGGVQAIAISHPHYYSSMIEWSRAFGDAPIYLHAADREWVMRPDAAIVFWEGATHQLWDGLTLIRCGGHFDGGSVLHWAGGAAGAGLLLTGDIIQVVSDRRWVSFMRSYPNLIPLPAAAVRAIVAAVEPFGFERIYGAWWDSCVASAAMDAVRRSADRYIAAIAE
jgi:hypothetical protein